MYLRKSPLGFILTLVLITLPKTTQAQTQFPPAFDRGSVDWQLLQRTSRGQQLWIDPQAVFFYGRPQGGSERRRYRYVSVPTLRFVPQPLDSSQPSWYLAESRVDCDRGSITEIVSLEGHANGAYRPSSRIQSIARLGDPISSRLSQWVCEPDNF
jgi:hypothetical protein